jgi:hypothetical protein
MLLKLTVFVLLAAGICVQAQNCGPTPLGPPLVSFRTLFVILSFDLGLVNFSRGLMANLRSSDRNSSRERIFCQTGPFVILAKILIIDPSPYPLLNDTIMASILKSPNLEVGSYLGTRVSFSTLLCFHS